ncbi:kinase-like domain-containing protein [Baffinella frigidus]|nr:kinase-like domain-containing protein [Cryptophyta sp. CCMP2293]
MPRETWDDRRDRRDDRNGGRGDDRNRGDYQDQRHSDRGRDREGGGRDGYGGGGGYHDGWRGAGDRYRDVDRGYDAGGGGRGGDWRRREDEKRGGGRGGKRHSRSRSRSRSSSGGSDDDEGHIASTITRITERFEVDKQLDRGTFGAVFKCYDRKHGEKVAIKVVRRVERYVEDAEIEVDILDRLRKLDKPGKHTLTLFKAFHYQGHYCIVTELLGSSLYLALKKKEFSGKP